jgi:hypothetical protein
VKRLNLRKFQHGFLKTNFERIEKKVFLFNSELGQKKKKIGYLRLQESTCVKESNILIVRL